MKSHAESGHRLKQKIVLSKRKFRFPCKKIRNVGISTLQGQHMKRVGIRCFTADFHPFASKRDGKVHYDSGFFHFHYQLFYI
jgi:hypothetical protein